VRPGTILAFVGGEKPNADDRNNGQRLALRRRYSGPLLSFSACQSKATRHMPCSSMHIMAKRKKLPPLTPRARQIVNLVINSVALGAHDNDAEIGAIAKQIGMSPARLQTTLNKLEEQGWVRIKHDFVYPKPAALRWQNPDMSENEAARMVRSLK
jgi:hypothetical protein